MQKRKPIVTNHTLCTNDILHSHGFAKVTSTPSSTTKIVGANQDTATRRAVKRRYHSSSVVQEHLHKNRQAKRFLPEAGDSSPSAPTSTPPTPPPTLGRQYNPYK